MRIVKNRLMLSVYVLFGLFALVAFEHRPPVADYRSPVLLMATGCNNQNCRYGGCGVGTGFQCSGGDSDPSAECSDYCFRCLGGG